MSQVGYVYAMKNEGTNIYKVGKTKRNPEIRAKEINHVIGGNKKGYVPKIVKKVKNISKAEKELKDSLNNNKVNSTKSTELYRASAQTINKKFNKIKGRKIKKK
jgi:hypothetical protein